MGTIKLHALANLTEDVLSARSIEHLHADLYEATQKQCKEAHK